MAEKEKCPSCGSKKFSISTDRSHKHFCQKPGCGKVWLPLTTDQRLVKDTQEQMLKFKESFKKEIQEKDQELEHRQTVIDTLEKKNKDLENFTALMLDPENQPPQYTAEEAWEVFKTITGRYAEGEIENPAPADESLFE